MAWLEDAWVNGGVCGDSHMVATSLAVYISVKASIIILLNTVEYSANSAIYNLVFLGMVRIAWRTPRSPNTSSAIRVNLSELGQDKCYLLTTTKNAIKGNSTVILCKIGQETIAGVRSGMLTCSI